MRQTLIMKLAILTLLMGSASQSQPVRMASFNLNYAPYDFAVSPDGAFSVVQASRIDSMLTIVYDLEGAAQLTALKNNLPQPISAVEAIGMTNSRAIVLGGAGGAAIQIINLLQSPPEILATFNSNYTPYDLKLTPNGEKAVVLSIQNDSHRTTIYDLTSGIKIATLDATSASQISAIDAVDATDTRAIMLGGAGSVSVGILNIAGQIPIPMASFNMNATPYDVEITPNGVFAVVRCFHSSYSQTIIYDLASATQRASFLANSTAGALAVNSIEATDGRAIVLGGPGQRAVEIYDLSDSPPTLMGSFFLNQTPIDVTITPNGLIGIVRSHQNENQLTSIFDLTTGTLEASLGSISGGEMNAVNAVEATNSRAIVLGGAGFNAVEIIDLSISPPQLLAAFGSGYTPHDLAIMPDGDHAVVRSRQNENLVTEFYDLNGATRITQFESTSGQPLGAINSVVATDTRIVSLGGAGTSSVEIFGWSQPCCDIAMIPDSYPISVPAGGSFGLTGVIGNPTDTSIVIDIWVGVKYSGNFYQIWNFANIPLNAGQIASAHLNQAVPSFAPLGTYEYIAYCGNKPEKCDSDQFQFTVSGSNLQSRQDDWLLSGGWKMNEDPDHDGAEYKEQLEMEIKPNPFNAIATVNFALPFTENIRLEIYNLLGQKTAVLFDGELNSGAHSFFWDGSNYAGGVYFVVMKSGNLSTHKKAILLK